MKLSYLGSIKDNVSGLEGSLGDEGSAISLISAFSTDLKEFKLHTVYFGTSEQIKPLQPVGQAAEFKFESKFEPLQVIWQSLPKAIPEDNRRFWLQNQWQCSWGRALAQLERVGLARSNTGRFRVGGSRCWPRQARLRKTCYHSCDTDSVRQSKRF